MTKDALQLQENNQQGGGVMGWISASKHLIPLILDYASTRRTVSEYVTHNNMLLCGFSDHTNTNLVLSFKMITDSLLSLVPSSCPFRKLFLTPFLLSSIIYIHEHVKKINNNLN